MSFCQNAASSLGRLGPSQGLGSIDSICVPSYLESQKYKVMFALAMLTQKSNVVTVRM